MKVELFEVCEGAFNHNGRLTLVEAFDNLNIQKVPAEATVGMASRILFSPEDRGRHTVTIRVTHPNHQGSPIADYNSEILVPDSDSPGKMLMAANVRGFKIPYTGLYTMSLLVDGNEIETRTFNVVTNEHD